MYHATRSEHVDRILAEGLRTGGVAHGVLDRWGENHAEHWIDEFYGTRPIYLLAEPAVPEGYEWERPGEEDPETPVLLAVDASGLRLLPDLCTLQLPHYVGIGADGI